MNKKNSRWKKRKISLRRRGKLQVRISKLRLREKVQSKSFEKNYLVEKVSAPETFLLENESTHDRVCEFLHSLRAACSRNALIQIDFRRVKKVYAGAMLLFFAELSRLKAIYPYAGWTCVPSRDGTVNQVLKHLGIFDALHYNSDVTPVREDVISWRSTTSTFVDEKSGELLEVYKSLSGEKAKHMFRGVAEATTNVVHHAYLFDRGDGLPQHLDRRWWMFCREDRDKLYVAICDLGVGIPRSLPAKYPREIISGVLSRFVGRSNDAKMISAAIEIARTRTDRKGRGKGLGDLKRVVDEVVGAKLFIFSNRGMVGYANGVESLKNFKKSILGTQIVWVLPIGDAK